MAIGNFLQYPDPVVAVLHTTSLAHYTLRYGFFYSIFQQDLLDEQDPANTSFQLAFTHDIGEPAHCMCVVDDEQHPQILVETVSCRLHLFQGDQCLFSRASLPALFPGPIAYHRLTSSLNIACGYHIYSVKFSLLSSLSNNGKKISVGFSPRRPISRVQFDWSFNCGDWPLQVFAVDHLPAQPSVLVVARRNIFCLPATEPDRIRWQVRLETIAISAHAYRCDDGGEPCGPFYSLSRNGRRPLSGGHRLEHPPRFQRQSIALELPGGLLPHRVLPEFLEVGLAPSK